MIILVLHRCAWWSVRRQLGLQWRGDLQWMWRHAVQLSMRRGTPAREQWNSLRYTYVTNTSLLRHRSIAFHSLENIVMFDLILYETVCTNHGRKVNKQTKEKDWMRYTSTNNDHCSLSDETNKHRIYLTNKLRIIALLTVLYWAQHYNVFILPTSVTILQLLL